MVCELARERVERVEPLGQRWALATGEEFQVAAAKRDPAAFAPLYERYVDAIYRYAYRRVGSHADAEDVTAQTFQKALAALPGYQWRGVPFGAWLFRIAANVIAQRGRRGSREVLVDDLSYHLDRNDHNIAASDDDPARLFEARAEAGELLAAIRRLPLDQQRVLVLKFARGLSNREIGEALGRSEGAVKQLTHRAVRTLRELLVTQGAGVTG
ncbi:MAG TPA: sigma-70 family RNA polymerase sigma factor [Thermomicrobiaceae bacterium]|nr:sigma-70 family RNA polymerase sigma factor [Thermomicrobiaceae bacterium]